MCRERALQPRALPQCVRVSSFRVALGFTSLAPFLSTMMTCTRRGTRCVTCLFSVVWLSPPRRSDAYLWARPAVGSLCVWVKAGLNKQHGASPGGHNNLVYHTRQAHREQSIAPPWPRRQTSAVAARSAQEGADRSMMRVPGMLETLRKGAQHK